MSAIIVGDICGNSLVILSVCRHSKLRVTTNWFVVSLACADILVALFAMTFNASLIISDDKWLFAPWVCDFWNSCDVLASTASILHLCCISIDRYIAIMRPLDYPMKITTKRVMYALCGVWVSSALLSCIPIFTGIYTTDEQRLQRKEHPEKCEFVVNQVYAVVSSSISFWIPCCIMVFTYYRIYREATRQEKFIYKAQSMMPAPIANHHHNNHHHHNNRNSAAAAGRAKQRRSKSMAVGANSAAGAHLASNEARIRNLANRQQQQHELQSAALTKARQQHQQLLAPAVTTTSTTIATTNLNAAPPGAELAAADNKAASAAKLSELGSPESEPLTAPAPDLNNNSGGGGTTTSDNNNAAGNQAQELAPLGGGLQQQQQPIQQPLQQQLSKQPAAPDQLPEGAGPAEDDDDQESNSGQSTPTKRSISKMKREHKAAKTLGIIMGVFILCWLPFFSWYTPVHICGESCKELMPKSVVTILFWIGYFNSMLNPIIYAYFNHEFRDAFKKTLQWIFCCCNDLKCLRVNRPNENQHYNCTYRSTQEIGLVNNS